MVVFSKAKKTLRCQVIPLAFIMMVSLCVSVLFLGFAHYHVALEATFDNTPSSQIFVVKNLRSSTPETTTVSLFNETAGCTITPSSDLTFLGSGDRGHAFSTFMTCSNGNRELVAIKVAKTWDGKAPQYISASNVDQKRALYERMLANSDPSASKFFSVQLGTATLQRDMLYEAMNQANEHVHRKVLNVTDDKANSSIVADVFAVSSGDELAHVLRGRGSKQPLPLDVRRQIAKDLVYIYRHLYEKGVVHCDVRMNHVLFSQADMQTMLIDFEEFRFVDEIDEKYRLGTQQEQLWQLFALLGNACAHQGSTLHFKFDVPWSSCNYRTKNKTDVIQRLVPALGECRFDSPMVWRNETGIDVAQTYRDLANWCGLQR